MLPHVQLFAHLDSQVLLHRTALNDFFSRPVLVYRILLTKCNTMHLALINMSFDSHMPTFWECLGPSAWHPSLLFCANFNTELDTITKFAESTLNPTTYITDKDVEKHSPKMDHWGTWLWLAYTWTWRHWQLSGYDHSTSSLSIEKSRLQIHLSPL